MRGKKKLDHRGLTWGEVELVSVREGVEVKVLVYMSNLRLLGCILLLYFGEGCSCCCCYRGKTKSTPSLDFRLWTGV